MCPMRSAVLDRDEQLNVGLECTAASINNDAKEILP